MNKIQDNTEDLHLEEDQAKAIAQLLNDHAQRLSMRTIKGLEDGRARAVNAHESKMTGHQVNHDGTLSTWTSWTGHPRLIGVSFICAALIIVLSVNMFYKNTNESSDAFLLGSELPPEAFVDRGFEPWLNAEVEL
ncbi:MAG TPA: DUF3619 domain-containing protein [Methylophilaceae bacterium]|nr:DUF3619 domain-containing protein [Methylophilaceae bacterium]HAJ72163.1 DUF3619 domain-containing protein [Methylophilaceae bacterium]